MTELWCLNCDSTTCVHAVERGCPHRQMEPQDRTPRFYCIMCAEEGWYLPPPKERPKRTTIDAKLLEWIREQAKTIERDLWRRKLRERVAGWLKRRKR